MIMNQYILAAFLAVFLLSACSTPNTGPGGFLNHDPVTKADHETLALFYQQASQKSALKAMAQENLLEQYRKEGNSGEGKQAENWEDHARRLIIHYEELSKENAEIAKIHQDIALELATQPSAPP